MHHGNVLISGASFAGLATAFWMKRAGYDVTVVETAPALRRGGTPVNIKGQTVGIARRMGLLDQIVANRIATNVMELWGAEGLIARSDTRSTLQQEAEGVEYEIERDVLTHLMFDLVKDDVEVIFNDSIARLQEQPNGVSVDFSTAARRAFSLVFGCDGIHSNVRECVFGGEAAYSHFLKTYGSVTIVPRLLIERDSLALYQAPGRSIILSTHHDKTDIVTLFSSHDRIQHDPRDRAQRVAILFERLAGAGWRIPELLGEIDRADNLYFSELAQIRMPAWSKGRVALVGDAGYCASPAAGMGGSLAIDGAAALGDAFAESGGDHVAAFRRYDEGFRPFVEQVQAAAVGFCEGIAVGAMDQGLG